MNAITKEQQAALTLPERAALALRTGEHEIKLRELLTNSARIVAPANKAARDECHAAYMVLKNTRCSIVNLASEATEDAKAFTKAVKVESDRLIAITTAEEARLQGLRDTFDEQVEAEKQARIAAERARTDAIQTRINEVRNLPSSVVGKSGAEISQMIYELAGTISADDAHALTFEEFADEYKIVRTDVLDLLAKAEQKQLDIEATARQAEAARIAEAERLAAEKVALAEQKAANDRAAAELAAERQRMADEAAAQQKAAAARQKEIDDAAKAARAEQARIAAEAQAKLEAQAAAMAEQSRKLAEQQAAADARDAAAAAATKAAEAAAIAREKDEARRNSDHGPALLINAEFDVAREAERIRLQSIADQAQADSHAPADTLDALLDMVDAGEIAMADIPVSDDEIITLMTEVYSMDRHAAIDRLQAIDFDAARGN